MVIKLDANSLKLMTLFETITRANLQDYFEVDGIKYFVVQKGEIGKAIGRQGANIRRLQDFMKCSIKIVEHSDDVLEFIKNLIYPLKLYSAEVKQENRDNKNIDVVYLEAVDIKTRGLIIGRNASSLRNLEKAIQRYFNVKEIKVM
ncbi:NusA-like transcription termination signal-binding factor [Candidatus Woesearchaeota archaeon]|nr:NusA-like transcription termination signal-binding factor [Candidatus Woesearchaeota archaeon]